MELLDVEENPKKTADRRPGLQRKLRFSRGFLRADLPFFVIVLVLLPSVFCSCLFIFTYFYRIIKAEAFIYF